MIRYAITEPELRARIESASGDWFEKADDVLSALPDDPASSDFTPIWSKIKQVYITLQHSKCCFCEKPLEGKIEQDVEHFRPKSEVKAWKVPDRLVAEGVEVRQNDDGSAEAGYTRLAYAPFNYAMACKTCNSTLKKNFFPIEGKRKTSGKDPGKMKTEKALFIYPIGSIDTDPETLMEFDGLSPVPKKKTGFGRRRALVTMEVFRLDDSTGRRYLFKLRACLLRLLYLELEGRANATTEAKRQKHQDAIDALISAKTPFANCMRSFRQLYGSDQSRAEQIADECVPLMSAPFDTDDDE